MHCQSARGSDQVVDDPSARFLDVLGLFHAQDSAVYTPGYDGSVYLIVGAVAHVFGLFLE